MIPPLVPATVQEQLHGMGMVGLFWGGLDICMAVTALAVLHAWHLPTAWGNSSEGGPVLWD